MSRRPQLKPKRTPSTKAAESPRTASPFDNTSLEGGSRLSRIPTSAKAVIAGTIAVIGLVVVAYAAFGFGGSDDNGPPSNVGAAGTRTATPRSASGTLITTTPRTGTPSASTTPGAEQAQANGTPSASPPAGGGQSPASTGGSNSTGGTGSTGGSTSGTGSNGGSSSGGTSGGTTSGSSTGGTSGGQTTTQPTSVPTAVPTSVQAAPTATFPPEATAVPTSVPTAVPTTPPENTPVPTATTPPATSTPNVPANMTLSPSSGKEGQEVKVTMTLSGFVPGSSVQICLDGILCGPITIEPSGGYTYAITIPSQYASGSHQLTASGGGKSAQRTFAFNP